MPLNATTRGTFPFGRPNSIQRMRRSASRSTQALIVGVYPSAFHVAWTPPLALDPREASKRARPFIGSLAVDVEPVVFWDGAVPAPADELERWKVESAFEDGRHGHVSVGNNGPSGAGLVKNVLAPLHLDASRVAFTDAVPWFFVKGGKGSQGEAIVSRFGPIALQLGLDPGSLPQRPSQRGLVEIAASSARRGALRSEIIEAEAPVIITLGQEALDAVRAVADEISGVQQRLSPQGYGAVGRLVVDAHSFDLMPLVHPGFQRQTSDDRWKLALRGWLEGATPLIR